MILNAKPNLISKGLPRPQVGITIWSQGFKIEAIQQKVDEWGNVQEFRTYIPYSGVIQPLRAEEIQLKPEYQWSWEWSWFHTPAGVLLKTNDRVVHKGLQYKVMSLKDYSDYGYVEYHVIKDWQGDPPEGDNIEP